MKQISKIYTFLFSIILCLSSCIMENDIDFDASKAYQGDKIVITGIITPSKVELIVKKTIDPSDRNSVDTLQNINVSLFSNNIFICNCIQEDGVFKLPTEIILNTNTEYYFKFSADNIDTAISNTLIIPTANKIDYAKYDSTMVNSYKYDKYLIFSFTDNSTLPNYYGQNIKCYYGGKYEEYCENFFTCINYFDDLKFNGKQHSFKYEVWLSKTEYSDDWTTHTEIPLDSVEVIHYTFTKEIYNFLESLHSAEGGQSNVLNDIPLKIECNIKNGYGFIAAFNADTATIIFSGKK